MSNPPSDSVALVMDSTNLEIKENKEKARTLAEDLRDLNKKTYEQEMVKNSKGKINEKQTYQNNWLVHKEHKPNSIIKPKVQDLIWDNFVNGMKFVDAMKNFKVSQHQIKQIKFEGPNLVRTHKKRAGKFTDDMKTELLHHLDRKSATTLSEMARFLKDRFDLTVSTQAISNLIHDMDISWKQVTNIPASWNKPDLLEQRANFVHRRGMDLGRKVVYVDESGFDLHSGRSSGYVSTAEIILVYLILSKQLHKYHPHNYKNKLCNKP